MHDLWMIEEGALAVLRERFAALASFDGKVLADCRAQFDREVVARRDDPPSPLTVTGSVARIDIVGDLSPEPDFLLWLFGIPNTAYSDIRDAVAAAELDPSVASVQFAIDSPGGTVEGFHETADAISSMSKPRSVRASLATSAAYGLAAAIGNVTAAGRQSTFGSVGVATRVRVSDYAVDIASSDAPDKRPDARTEEGKAAIRRYLDQVHALFAEQIAAGRGTTVDVVNASYGRGGLLLAEEALRRGMIDAIADKPRLAIVQSPAAKGGEGETGMNLEELLAAHPKLCAEIKQSGVAQERDRVSAHLRMGEASGDMKTAVTACREGTEMTMDMQAAYMAAGMNRRSQADAQADADDAAPVADGAQTDDSGKSLMEQGLDILAARRGQVVTHG